MKTPRFDKRYFFVEVFGHGQDSEYQCFRPFTARIVVYSTSIHQAVSTAHNFAKSYVCNYDYFVFDTYSCKRICLSCAKVYGHYAVSFENECGFKLFSF